jgi:hypothetical protein
MISTLLIFKLKNYTQLQCPYLICRVLYSNHSLSWPSFRILGARSHKLPCDGLVRLWYQSRLQSLYFYNLIQLHFRDKERFTLLSSVERTKDFSNLVSGEQKFVCWVFTLEANRQQPPKCLYGSRIWEFWHQEFV